MSGTFDDKKSMNAGPSNQGIPTPIKNNLRIEIDEDPDASKSKVDMSACDQSMHDINDVASQYTAYMREKQNALL